MEAYDACPRGASTAARTRMSPSDTVTDSPAAPVLSMADAQPVEDVPHRPLLAFPTVAIGASAGGVEALQRLFGAMPVDSGCAFVVVMHLAPERESMLAP